MNVLLVDDEPLELEQLEFLIQPLFPKWKLYKSQNANEALDICEKKKIDLAFLDISLPGKSGLELGEQLRSHNPEMDLIIVSAHNDFSFAKQSIRLGVINYITKPVIESELIETLKQYKDLDDQLGFSVIIEEALKFIHTHYGEKISLERLAQQVHVNPTYLSRRFHEEVGESFSEYLSAYRVEMAKKLLLTEQGWSMYEISEKTGFNSQHYFSTTFRKLTGCSPKEFRERGK